MKEDVIKSPDLHADTRAREGLDWARGALAEPGLRIEPLAGDASFRRYFRVRVDGSGWVLMDAPPDREDCEPFLDVARRLREAGVHAPRIDAADRDRGYLLLEDLGDDLLRDALDERNADQWFPRLLDLLARLGADVEPTGLPTYDRARLRAEMDLFPDWYLGRHRGLRLDDDQRRTWEELTALLISSASAQRQVFVHRDFHSCNLLTLAGGELGVIDFQDAVRGPLTYDLASLLWDRYIAWPRERLEDWMEGFRRRMAPETPSETWVRQVDWMGLQRNLKIVGIFARLRYRDDKAGYLELIPRFWGYVRDVLSRYPEFRPFDDLLESLACAP